MQVTSALGFEYTQNILILKDATNENIVFDYFTTRYFPFFQLCRLKRKKNCKVVVLNKHIQNKYKGRNIFLFLSMVKISDVNIRGGRLK